MGWIIFIVVLALVSVTAFVVFLVSKASIKGERDSDKLLNLRVASWVSGAIAFVVAPVLAVTVTAGNSVYQIPAGSVGVVSEFGAIKSQTGEGLQWVAPWRDIRTATVQIERHVFDNLASFSLESQDVFVKATLNIRVSPDAIQQLYRNVGDKYFEVLVASRVAQNFKDETVKYKSVDIAPNREKIRKSVSERLEKELHPYSIQVVDLLLDNVDFRPEFKGAIEAKQIATQRALEEEQKVAIERHRADQNVARARGEGDALLAIAEKQAEANHKLSESLTPQLVHYAMIQKLSDKIRVMILPSGQSFILGPDMMKEARPTEASPK
ncbi:MAG: SPFH domain-containing protein [bacterium]|nr:SPFH domain-containing protein [bacterium]